ncbi:hypothetical protein NHX12_003322 [Muraenolepis orangiensis]|uniref:CBM21 domain-containing protein n=1 Tax=Muraenolepis orangiensis TaxID=630683 RepID=A0A9Q0IE11_9TELE|nr:hypothetical protein NHX12_003322 [Muraenolepis orangiensis]
MAFAAVEHRTFGPADLLRVPGPGLASPDSDDEDCEAVAGIVPNSSPQPRRKTSASEEEDEAAETASSSSWPSAPGSRRVSFADAKGLSLALVKEFDTWGLPDPPDYDPRLAEGGDGEGYSYYLSFPCPLPTSPQELGSRVREQKVELESVELLPGTTVLRGLVRVLNISFHKTVFVRFTLDAWASHFDLLAEYVKDSGDGVTDCFSFKLTLVPPFAEQGARVDFCLRYETPIGTFWANNGARNYVLLLHQRARAVDEPPQEQCVPNGVGRKSCLKAARQNFATVDNSSSEENVRSIEKISTGVSKNGGALDTKAGRVSDSASEDECHEVTTESSGDAGRRTQRRAARQAKVKDLFSQRDHKPEREKQTEASLPPPPADGESEDENPAESTVDPPLSRSGDWAPSAPLQSGESSVAEKPESVGEEKLEQKRRSAASLPGGNRQRPSESIGESDQGSDDVCIVNHTEEESHSDVSLAENTGASVTAPCSFTFGTVLAPLYPSVCGRSQSQGHPMRGPSMMGDALENCASIPADLAEDTSGIGGDDRRTMNTHLKDVLGEDVKPCVSVAADTNTKHADINCQESEHECTNNPQPTADVDTTPSDVNNEVWNACTARAGTDLQGKTVEVSRALGCQWKNPPAMQIMADAAKAQREAEEVLSDIQNQLDRTQPLSQPQVLQETPDARSQPHMSHMSPFVMPCEIEQHIPCDTATGFICTDSNNSNEQGGVQPAMSTTNIYPDQGRATEQLEELDPEAADVPVGDQSVPEPEDECRCSAVDLSHETLTTSLEVGEDPDRGE